MSTTYGYRGPTIDHSGLSPSGHVSKRARAAWQERENARLFPPGYWDEPPKTDAQKRAERLVQLRRLIADLRHLAAGRTKRCKWAKEAERLEAEAAALEASN